MNNWDTIFALSSGKLPSGIAVFRISGSKTRQILEEICGIVPPARVMRHMVARDIKGDVIDSGLCVYFPQPNSFTGEDSAELHVHGSLAVARKLSGVLAAFENVRFAEPGEFTKRAFLNGKLDLAEAEGLSDLIVAETEAQRRLALVQSGGKLSGVYEKWREDILQCRAMVEAAIDFSDEEDVQKDALAPVLGKVSAIAAEISDWLARSAHSGIVRDGFRVVIVGAPNAGKSSLLNCLAGREAAIISDEPGTTRDLIDVRLELGGNLVIVTDTAGIREAPGKVEQIGIEMAMKRAEQADLVLLMQVASGSNELAFEPGDARILRVGSKSDLGVADGGNFDLLISVLDGSGVDELIHHITEAAESVSTGDAIVAQERQKLLLIDCVGALKDCRGSFGDLELVAENLRVASDCIGRLTGKVDVEELLGVIFSRFCIGK